MHALHDETTSETLGNFIAFEHWQGDEEDTKKTTSENSMTHSSGNTSSK